MEEGKAKLDQLAIETAPTEDAEAAQKALDLGTRLEKLKGQVGESLTEFAKDDTESSLEELNRNRASAQSRMLAVAEDRSKTMLEREEQELAFKTFTNLSRQKHDKCEALKKKMDGQIDDVDKLKDDIEDFNDTIN